MKSWLSICLTVLVAGCTAMREPAVRPETNTVPMSVTIDFQTGFTGNWVQLKLGEEQIFSGALTTDNRIGLAGRLRLTTSTGTNLAVTVTVDRSKTYPFQVNLDRGRHLGLSKDLDDGSIRLTQNRDPFMYD
jgi:hypothetical protein